MFNNPIVIDSDFGNFSLPYSSGEESKLEKEKAPDAAETPDKDVTVDDKKTEEPAKRVADKEFDMTDSPAVEMEQFRTYAVSLLDDDLLDEAPEGFDTNKELTADDYHSLVKTNLKAYKEQISAYEEFLENLSSTTKQILEYEDNGGKDTSSFIQSLVYQNQITELDPTNDIDAERILSEWYTNQGYDSAKTKNKIERLKNNGSLLDEAQDVKPQLDLKAKAIADAKLTEQKEIAEFEARVKTTFANNVKTVLKTGKLEGKAIPQNVAQRLEAILTTDNVAVVLPNKQKAHVSYVEAMMLHHRFSKEGSIERLALAMLLLDQPEEFKKVYATQAVNEEVSRVAREHKLNNLRKGGSVPEQTRTPKNDISHFFSKK